MIAGTPLALFATPPSRESIVEGAVVLRGHAMAQAESVIAAIDEVIAGAPFRHLVTPGGLRMSVAMSNCGTLGWVSDRRGYRYSTVDPLNGQPWPAMPAELRRLAQDAAQQAGFDHFQPDACLINRYVPGARLSLHQDRDEQDFAAPIVSVSLGLPAVFVFGGARRTDATRRIPLQHGDIVVWGGPARRYFHGVLALKSGLHGRLGEQRINLTFRKAG